MELSLEAAKSKAIAKLKFGVPCEVIAKELEISVAVVQEWKDYLSPSQLQRIELNSIAVDQAVKVLRDDQNITSEQLKSGLYRVALTIIDEMAYSRDDPEIARSLNITADTIAKLQTAFFGKTAEITVVPTANIKEESVSSFKNMLRQ